MIGESDIDVISGDRSSPRQEECLPAVVVLDRLRSAHNVGNIFRLAEATRIRCIYACGYTPAPPHLKLAKTARGCDELVPCRTFPDAREAVIQLKARGYTIYGVDTIAGAVSYCDAAIRFPAAFIMGNEALGISPEALECCDGFISLPALGCKNSINVGNCCAVILFEALRQWQLSTGRRSSLTLSGRESV